MYSNEYESIINLIRKLGDTLPSIAGKIADIGVKKVWLTEKDIEFEKEITRLISTFEGNNVVYAEELHAEYKEGENVWIVDPISSTATFIHGLYHYSVVVAHLHKGVLQFAAMYDPSVKELFTAYKGKGAFLNNEKIQVSKRDTNLYIIYTPETDKIITNEKIGKVYSELCKLGTVRSIGSVGLHYAYVAAGRADCAITVNKDTFTEFAGKLLVEEAGGKSCDFDKKEISQVNNGVLMSNNVIFERIFNIIKNN